MNQHPLFTLATTSQWLAIRPGNSLYTVTIITTITIFHNSQSVLITTSCSPSSLTHMYLEIPFFLTDVFLINYNFFSHKFTGCFLLSLRGSVRIGYSIHHTVYPCIDISHHSHSLSPSLKYPKHSLSNFQKFFCFFLLHYFSPPDPWVLSVIHISCLFLVSCTSAAN